MINLAFLQDQRRVLSWCSGWDLMKETEVTPVFLTLKQIKQNLIEQSNEIRERPSAQCD